MWKFFNLCILIFVFIFVEISNEFSIGITNRNSIFDKSADFNRLQQTPANKLDTDCDNNWQNSKQKSDENNYGILKKSCDPCPENVQCIPKIQCPSHVRLNATEKPQICDLPSLEGETGYCCSIGQNWTNETNKRTRRTVKISEIENSIIENAQRKFENLTHQQQIQQQQQLPASTSVYRTNHQPEFFHNLMFHSAIPTEHISELAMKQIFASQFVKEQRLIPTEDFIQNNIDLNFQSSVLGQECIRPIICQSNFRYRTIDGTCNNQISSRSLWGSAGQPMERILPPAYEDGIWLPRIHSNLDGSLLTSARDVSRFLFDDINRPHPRYNLLLMQFGQFISHDLTQSVTITLPNGQNIECCTENGFEILPPNNRHFACLPIPIAPDDEFYSTFNQRCMNFVRLALAPDSDCTAGYAKQINKVTHYLDGSHIYGSDVITARNLRTFNGGRLQMFFDFGRELLPLTRDPRACGNSVDVCFQSGDGRTNQIISLTVLHTIFAREHNRIAEILAKLNPHFSDETLYQETRRIVIAEYQHVVFNEWLPAVIGSEMMKKFKLRPRHHSYATDYSPDINVAMTNEFTGAAFRFGHSTVDGFLRLRKTPHTFQENIQIPDVMFNPGRIREDLSFLNALVTTLTEQPMQKVDDSITHGLSRFLFRGMNPFGLDLAAINIQRGRDHALRSYNDYLELIGRQKIKSFNQFKPEISRKLQEVYRHPDDIDLWVGGLLEKSFKDSVVGSTFAEIIADQFSRLRRGDRYFYENSPKINPNGYLNHDQLKEIRKVTMARILCDNLDLHVSINSIPPLAFLRSDLPGNGPVHCESVAIPRLDLSPWKA